MLVRELIQILESYDLDREVVLSIDSEGNRFHPADEDIMEGHYVSRELEVYTDEDYEADPDSPLGVPCVVIYPLD